MRKIIRLTESDLHNMVRNALKGVLRESNDRFVPLIAKAVEEQWEPETLTPGENEIDVEPTRNMSVFITFNLVCNPYIQPGMRSQSRDVPDDPDEIVDEPKVKITQISMYLDENEKVGITDDGTIQSVIQEKVNNAEIKYDWNRVPSREEFFYHED
jgi:hypothetical protein